MPLNIAGSLSSIISLLKASLERSKIIIQLRNKFGLDLEQLPADFDTIYIYSVVDFSEKGDKRLLDFFRSKDVIKLFNEIDSQDRTCIYEENIKNGLIKIFKRVKIFDEISEYKGDEKEEFFNKQIVYFIEFFKYYVNKSRSPGERELKKLMQSIRRVVISPFFIFSSILFFSKYN